MYMTAFNEAGSYFIFVVMTLMLVQAHQQFAKQMTIGFLLAFVYMSVSLKMPKEANSDENVVIQAVNALFFFDKYCYFEVAFILKNLVYPSLFNTTLNISRLIDVEPSQEYKRKISEAQKRLTKAFLPLEMIMKRRETDEDYQKHLTKEAEEELKEAEEEKEKATKELKEAKNGEGKELDPML